MRLTEKSVELTIDDDAKKLAIAYCLWYERKDEKLNRVDEDEVNKYLSEWEYETQ